MKQDGKSVNRGTYNNNATETRRVCGGTREDRGGCKGRTTSFVGCCVIGES